MKGSLDRATAKSATSVICNGKNMNCPSCGAENRADSKFCRKCGENLTVFTSADASSFSFRQDEEGTGDANFGATNHSSAPFNGAGSSGTNGAGFGTSPFGPRFVPIPHRVMSMLTDPLFLVIAILETISVATSILYGSIPILSIIFAIYLWITFANSKKNILPTENMKGISGTIFAEKIIYWILIGLMGLLLIIFILMAVAFISSPDTGFIDRLFAEILPSFFELPWVGSAISIEALALTAIEFAEVILVAIFIAFAVGIAVMVVFTIFGHGAIHHFAKTLYRAALDPSVKLEKIKAARNWLFVFGVLSALSITVSSFTLFVSSGCKVATYIIASLLIRKHFKDIENI